MASTAAEMRQQAREFGEKYVAQGGGVTGAFVAANEQWNPAYGAIEHGVSTVQSLRRGDWHAVGEETTRTLHAVAATVGIAEGAGSLLKGVLKPGLPKAGLRRRRRP